MFATACPQCKRAPDGGPHRLVRDSCGHQKCRMCLLVDEERCRQCASDSHTATTIENRAGVITCNGSAKKLEAHVAPLNGLDERKSGSDKAPKSKKVKSSKSGKFKRIHKSSVVPSHVTALKDPVRYKCELCNKQFGTKSHIKYHVYCTGQAKPFQCGICFKAFITKSHLDVHILKHTGTRPYSCAICKKTFNERSKLNRHNLLHTTSKPYVCSECGKSFRGKESLKIHTLIHRGEKPYACRICNVSFNNTSNLNKHLISHSNEKAHMCDQCGKRFKLKWALTVHRRSHLRIRPFECSTCSRSFINNKDLQRHQLIHLETKAYKCSICSTCFRRKDNLYRHVKNTHPGKKVDSISTTVKQLLVKPPTKPVDNPNAINVITASPACKKKGDPSMSQNVGRTGTVINGPLKLAFKTSAFKNSYNIHRDYDYDALMSKSYDMAESVNICQKILSPHSPPARTLTRTVDEPSSTEICQKILSPYPSRPIHYETSFEHKKHAIIKNIKFKLPPNYTNLKSNETLKDIIPLKPVTCSKGVDMTGNGTYAELKSVPNAATSVIVNTSLTNSNMHWRRRTSQNLCSKILEN